ncbi:hypothetical protein OC844_001650 [Tilletia horrida]|nr:hypothetical protein OC844_001650 [Tilletia horrida]
MRTAALASFLGAAALAHAHGSSSPHAMRRQSVRMAKRQEPQPGDTLYVNAPACDYYRCHVTYSTGDIIEVNWINAPANGNVQVSLMTEDSSTLVYNITTAPPTVPTNFCDSDDGLGVAVNGRTCGRVNFKLPSFVASGNYTFRVNSLPPAPYQDQYTDIVIVKKTSDNVQLQLTPLTGADGKTLQPTGAAYEGDANIASITTVPPAGATGAASGSAPASTSTKGAPASSNANATTTTPATTAPAATNSTSSAPAASATKDAKSGAPMTLGAPLPIVPVAISAGSALVAAFLCLA